MTFNKLKPTSDADYEAYSEYIAKLAAVAAPGDPPATPFRVWFLWRHGAFPADELIKDQPARLPTSIVMRSLTPARRPVRQQPHPAHHTVA